MNIIKRKLVKTSYYSRKSPNKAIDLERLGLNDKYSNLSEAIDCMSDAVIDRIDMSNMQRVLRIVNSMSGRIVLTESQIERDLSIILKDMFKDYYQTKELGFYRAEYFSVMLTLNKSGKHIVVILPNVDVL